MRRVEIIICGCIIAVLATLWAPLVGAAPKPPIKDYFKVDWSSVRYNKSVTVNNPQVSSQSQANQTSEQLNLSLEVEVSDPNRIIGISSQAEITQLTDAQSQTIPITPSSSPASRLAQRYDGLRYRQEFVTPTPLPKWRQVLQSVLRIKSQRDTRPHRVKVLRPSSLSIQLDTAMLPSTGAEIGRIEGHFYALSVDSIEYVDIPFEPNNTWVRVTPTQEIRVVEAKATASSYNYRIEANDQGATMGSFDLRPGNSLPSRLVIERQFLGPDGKSIHPSRMLNSLRVSLGGRGSGSGGNGPVKTIRYVIGVNPKHNQIPFVLEHIPLPKP